jgi:hypothetical protein
MSDDELLTAKPFPANEALKADLLANTVRRMRLAVWRRRAVKVAVGLACFGLGLATTHIRPAPAPEVHYVEVPVAPAPAADTPGSPIASKDETPAPLAKALSPAQLELVAEQTTVKAEAARRFREAGDLYVRELADYRAALRCYRYFLDEADPADRAISPDDTWLLTSLKRAREQESTQ